MARFAWTACRFVYLKDGDRRPVSTLRTRFARRDVRDDVQTDVLTSAASLASCQ